MTVAYWCVLVAAILPIVWAGAAKFGAVRTAKKPYSNARPREFLAALTGWPERAQWAQENSYEAFPPFAAAVIIAHVTGNASQDVVNTLAVIFIAARVLYGLCYIFDRSTLRSFVWLAGLLCVIGLFVTAA